MQLIWQGKIAYSMCKAVLQSSFALFSLQPTELLNKEGEIILCPHLQKAMGALSDGCRLAPPLLIAQIAVHLVNLAACLSALLELG